MMTSSFLPCDLSVRRAWRKAIQHLKELLPSDQQATQRGRKVTSRRGRGRRSRLYLPVTRLPLPVGTSDGRCGGGGPSRAGSATSRRGGDPPRGKSWGPRTLPSRFQPARTSDPKLRKFTVKLKSDFQYHPEKTKLGVIFDLGEQQTLVQALLPTSGLTKNLGLACDWRLQYTIVTKAKLGHLLVASSIGRVDNDMMLAYCIKTVKEKKEGQKQTCQL